MVIDRSSQQAVLSLEPVARRRLFRNVQDPLGLNGLLNVVERPQAHRIDGAIDAWITGHDHDFRSTGGQLELSEHLEPRHPGQKQIQQDNIVFILPARTDTVLGGLDPLNAPFLACEDPVEIRPNCLVVFDDQNGKRLLLRHMSRTVDVYERVFKE
jgi:hypothetical protein